MLGLPEISRGFASFPEACMVWPDRKRESNNLAAAIDLINRQLRKSIVTIEDPIEFLHKQRSLQYGSGK